jgi:solute carrier family 13 (sodium-dependent dicarboxylate transporter), member 2/3/5
MARTLSENIVIVPGEVISSGDLLSNGRIYLGLLLGPLVACLLWLLPFGLEAVQQKTLAIVLFMVVYWIAEPVDHAVTALIGCYLFWALGSVNFSIAFSGFASAPPWFLFGGALMAEAATCTGLAKRLGFQVLSRAGTSYIRLLFGIAFLSVLAAPLIPSATARIVIIAPLVIGVLSAVGSSTRSNFAKGSFLCLTMMSMLIDKMILAGATPVLAQGIIKEHTGTEILWGEWFIAFLPATILTCLAVIVTAYWLFPSGNAETPAAEEYLINELRRLGPLSAKEKKLLVVLGCAITAWATDYIHHLEPTTIALGAGLFLVLPKVGVLDTGAVKKINFLVIIFSAGALSMANVLAQTSSLENLNGLVAGRLGAWLSDGVLASISLYWGGVLYHFIFPNNQSLLSTSLPLLLNVASEMPVNSAALGLIWQFATGGTLFAYQSSILVMGYSYGCFDSRDLLKYGAIMTVIEALILMLLVPLYWPLVGLAWIK